jgi:hypothetical protein
MEAGRNDRTIVVVPMTGPKNYYFSVPSIILKTLFFISFIPAHAHFYTL